MKITLDADTRSVARKAALVVSELVIVHGWSRAEALEFVNSLFKGAAE